MDSSTRNASADTTSRYFKLVNIRLHVEKLVSSTRSLLKDTRAKLSTELALQEVVKDDKDTAYEEYMAQQRCHDARDR